MRQLIIESCSEDKSKDSLTKQQESENPGITKLIQDQWRIATNIKESMLIIMPVGNRIGFSSLFL